MISKKNGWGNKSWKRKGKAALEDVKQQEEDTGEKWTETWLRELSDEDVTNKCLRQPSEQISSPIQSITNQQTNFFPAPYVKSSSHDFEWTHLLIPTWNSSAVPYSKGILQEGNSKISAPLTQFL